MINDATRIAFQMAIEEFVYGATDVHAVTVPAHADHRVNQIARAEQRVETLQPGDDALVIRHRKVDIVIGIDEQQRTRADERTDRSPIPARAVVKEKAIAVAADPVL